MDGESLYFTGYTEGLNTPNLRDILVGEISKDGEIIKVKRMGKYHSSEGIDMIVTTKGKILITGRITETALFTV